MNISELEKILISAAAPLEKQPAAPMQKMAQKIYGVIIGELVGMADEGRMPLVCYPGQPGAAALLAQTTENLQAQHIGKRVVLMFENGEPLRPIVMGCLREQENQLAAQPGHVEIDADGEQMTVTAKHQVVIRCGKASITLTKAGKVLIQGTYILSRSSGVNRIKGGAVQLN